jgi:hypothetical protein
LDVATYSRSSPESLGIGWSTREITPVQVQTLSLQTKCLQSREIGRRGYLRQVQTFSPLTEHLDNAKPTNINPCRY